MIRTLLRWLTRALLRVRLVGDLTALEGGRRLVVANHDSLLDGVLLGLFLPGAPTVVVTPEALRHPLVRLFRRAVCFVVLDPARPLALKHLIRQVQKGETVVIFPQGRVSTTGGIMKVYDSAGVIAARSGAHIVPVHISGTLYSRVSAVRGAYPKRWFPRVVLTVQPPVEIAPMPHVSVRDRRRRRADEMLQILQTMMFDARPRQTLYEALLDAVALHGRRTKIIEDAREQPESYHALLKATLGLARISKSVSTEGETLGVMLPNLSTTVALVFGLTAMRRVAAMLNYSAGPEAMHAACCAAGIRTIITSRRFIKVARLEASVRALHGIDLVYLEDLRAKLGLVDKLWIVAAMLRPRSAMPAQDPSAVAVVLFTSGSEARSKGVAISHDAMLANMAQMRAVIDFGPNDKYLNALPMYHTYGLTACTLMPILTGTRLFLYTTPLHYRLIPEFAYTRECTYLFGTSTFLGHYARQAHEYDFCRLRVVVSGGEKLNPEVESLWLRKFGLRIMEGYGATECGPTLALNTPLSYRQGTVGRLLPRIESRTVAVPGIQGGCALHVRSPHLMTGYYFSDEPGVLHTPRSEVGVGWYNTGDVVDIDDDGYVTILGRVKRFAKIAGEMVSLELVERIAYAASPEHKHAATVEQISGSGESTVLFTTDARLDRLTLVKAARQTGAQDLAVARRIVKVASLPLLGSGKTDYVTLKRMTTKVG
ncbi:MAG: bifunctional 2-acylglycerophosphoethanolamine acyltransferase/acyl-ACP synthetase [Betaproteobacteria bacterium]|nr:bifunctional 2-acylglycerophosphoethanolamine acyltransferase/acyl-ACP synthetase [Betaproteobacteria bacterium]